MKYIYQHLGLGDHFICHGLVRHFSKLHSEISIFCKPHYTQSVEFMYKDIKNLTCIPADDVDVRGYIKSNNININDLIVVGHGSWHPQSKNFAESFYLQHNLSLDLKWDNFFVQRDTIREQKIIDYFGVKKNEYIFIHDDHTRDLNIDNNSIENHKNLEIIRPEKNLTENIFDYCGLIENSYSAHFMDSSFKQMCDLMELKNENIFLHRNIKSGMEICDPYWVTTSKLNFRII
jgi:hypothetical protein